MPHVRTNVKPATRITLLSVAAVAALGYGSTLAALLWLQGRLIYPRERLQAAPRNPAADAIDRVTLETRDGLALEVRYRAAAHPEKPVVVLFHGNGEDLTQRAYVAHDLIAGGYGVLLAEYRGYGGNPGKPHEAGLYLDGRAALEFALQRSPRVVVHGYSLGSGVAVQLATEFDVDALILEAPFTSITDVACTRYPHVPVRWLMRDRYDNRVKIGRVRAPVLIYGGDADGVIPPRQFAQLFAAVRAPRRLSLVAGADHVDVWARGGRTRVLAFLDALARPASA